MDLPNKKVPLIIPVENQVRELDPKLLLACVAAKRGFTCIIGSHRILSAEPVFQQKFYVLGKISANMPGDRSISKRTQRWLITPGLHLAKAIKSHLPGSHNRPEFQKHRFPGIAPDKLAKRIERFQQLLGDTHKLQVEPISDVLVRISP
jgi:hypothetical protein